MEMDMNINDILDILREVITFLEYLRNAQLPLTLDKLREKLLVRSRNTLSKASSPEPYLDMKCGSSSLMLTRSIVDSEEYIGMEESQKHTEQDYYESFEDKSEAASVNDNPEENDEGEMLIEIYRNLSAMQIKSKCHKCGPLYRKGGKKLFLSESRACWVVLVGAHLLIYRSERHNRPYAIHPIRGYMARPAPSMIPRDRRKSESAFEMYSPGSETLQFIARSPKDMEQWIAKICEVGCNRNENQGRKAEGREKMRPIVKFNPSTEDRKGDEATCHRDAEKSADKSTSKLESASDNKNEVDGRKDSGGRAPSLPARIPRGLPSLPPTNPLAIPFYDATEDDDNNDDDIYHRIEDLRNETCYQNVALSKRQQAADASDVKQKEAIAYDDVRALSEPNERMEGQTEEEAKSCDAVSFQETYDDIVTLSRIDVMSIEPERSRDNAPVDGKERKEEFYDDVESLIPNRRFPRDHVEVSSKIQKRSFLDKVLNRKEFPGKHTPDKRYKSKVSSNSSLDTEEISTSNDVPDLMPNQESLADREELPEYNCPPPPRPIYKLTGRQSPDTQTEEFYDDVSAIIKNHQQITLQSRSNTCTKANQVQNAVHNVVLNGNSTQEETEHYQLPRSDLCICERCVEHTRNEQCLYDDIALWANFTARQRDTAEKKETEDAKSTNTDKKSWNRFAINRKSRVMCDFNCSAETNKRGDSNEERDEIEDSSESNGTVKKKTLQKLFSRMENSLAKVSRNPPSFSMSKSSASSNNS